MDELHEFTMTPKCAAFLRNELELIIKHCDIDTDTAVSLINLCAALSAADRVEITIKDY